MQSVRAVALVLFYPFVREFEIKGTYETGAGNMSCGVLFFSDVPQAVLACAINTPSILVSAESHFCVNLCVYEVNKLDGS